MPGTEVAAVNRTKTYVAVYERDDQTDAWIVHVRGLNGCQTYGRSFRQAQGRIREALAVWLKVEPDSLSIREEVPAPVAAVAASVAQARREAERAGAQARAETAAAVKQLTELGLSRRDTAQLLGLSHQRIQQLFEAS